MTTYSLLLMENVNLALSRFQTAFLAPKTKNACNAQKDFSPPQKEAALKISALRKTTLENAKNATFKRRSNF